MQAYISIGYHTRKQSNTIIEAIVDVLTLSNISPFVFVDEYTFSASEESQMMRQAFAEIDKSDLLIAEVSEKGIGIGVEVGYAIAKRKPVIYLRRATAEHSTTVSGASDFQIIYNDVADLKLQLGQILRTSAGYSGLPGRE
jgi:nucleoside 2-deoxyribosyltransferase